MINTNVSKKKNFFSSIINKEKRYNINRFGLSNLTLSKLEKSENLRERIKFFVDVKDPNNILNIIQILIVKSNGELVSNVIYDVYNFTINNVKLMCSIIKNLINNFGEKKKDTFITIKLSNEYVITLFFSNLIFVCFSIDIKLSCRAQLLKLFLQFFSISFYNFIGQDNEIITDKKFQDINTNYAVKVYENLFAIPLIQKFGEILHILSQQSPEQKLFNVNNNESLFPNNRAKINIFQKHTKKNIYIFHYRTKDLLFDLRRIINKKNNLKIYKKTAILNNLFALAEKLANAYNNGLYSCDNSKLFKDKCVTCELLATYPRKFFIVKFFALHYGYVLIEEYNINKISRDHCFGHEIEEKYPLEIYQNESNNKEEHNRSPYNLPLPLNMNDIIPNTGVDDFLIEYYGNINSATSFYVQHNTDLKYFNKDIILILLKLLRSKHESFEELINKVNSILVTKNKIGQKKKNVLDMGNTFIVKEIEKKKERPSFMQNNSEPLSNTNNGMEMNNISIINNNIEDVMMSRIEYDNGNSEIFDSFAGAELNNICKNTEVMKSMFGNLNRPFKKITHNFNNQQNFCYDNKDVLENKLNLLKDLQIKLKSFKPKKNLNEIKYKKRQSVGIPQNNGGFSLVPPKRSSSNLNELIHGKLKYTNEFKIIRESRNEKNSDKNSLSSDSNINDN